MAEILSAGPTGDGYDVRCLLVNGDAVTFHFRSQTAFASTPLDELEQAYIESVTPEEFEIIAE